MATSLSTELVDDKICALMIDSCIFGTVSIGCGTGLAILGVAWAFAKDLNPLISWIILSFVIFISVFIFSRCSYMYDKMVEKELRSK